ncbi:TLD-domain-containing protein [Basidiobolus meristosporus CBS 931.73]|uniref:Restriction of telomere capping protein 5 n=1 Tax=Basidiobolus meristosporus CBS 931.73 TaxID=1314790 RepID=A0A1Y1Z4K0_9FUNG|nr:TLD-domain-containing protein [Basidiobolus meristosporus CBS 931.73]|eukprot:ORY05126.1 TLD-domain-containing protein [Basidiobolus meristosporus CBS 931.73]
MGQEQSAFSSNHSFPKAVSQGSATTSSSLKRLEPKLTPLEVASINQVYQQLKSIDRNEAELITEEAFQQYLGLPENMLIGKILYRSFVQLPYLANYEEIHENATLNYSLLLYSIRFYCGEGQSLEVFLSSDPAPIQSMPAKLLFKSLGNIPAGGSAGGISVACQDLLELCKGILWILKAHYLTLLAPNAALNELVVDEKPLISIVQQMAIIERESRGLPKGSFSDGLPGEDISWSTFKDFVQRSAPAMFKILERFIYTRFCMNGASGKDMAPSRWVLAGVEDMLPKIDLQSNLLKIEDWGLLTWLLPDSRGRSWDVLYSGSRHGFSISYLEAKVFKYSAPTCLLIKGYPTVTRRLSRNRFLKVAHDPGAAEQELILGAYISEPWKFSRGFWGTADCRLFELGPVYEVFPVTGNSDTYAYCHRSNGIGFGGRINEFRLHIKPDFLTGTYSNDPLHGTWSYKLSATRADFDITFQIEDIEVIGMGGEVAREQQIIEWLYEEQERARPGYTNSHSSEHTRRLLEQAGILEHSKKLDAFRTRRSFGLKKKPSRYTPYR